MDEAKIFYHVRNFQNPGITCYREESKHLHGEEGLDVLAE
jgi:hypothetical protein